MLDGLPTTTIRAASPSAGNLRPGRGDRLELANLRIAGGRIHGSGIALTATACSFEDSPNSAIYLDSFTNILDLDGCRFVGNTNSTAGGAIYMFNGGRLRLTGCTFLGNIVPTPNANNNYPGGAIYTWGSSSKVEAFDCLFEANQAKLGSAITADGAARRLRLRRS